MPDKVKISLLVRPHTPFQLIILCSNGGLILTILYQSTCFFSPDPVDIAQVGVVQGLAVDWMDKTLYWVDSSSRILEAARLDGSRRRVLYRYQRSSANPRGIALHPRIG